METFLLTWNPTKFSWIDLPELANQSQRGQVVEGRWIRGRTKTIKEGARLFLHRQGVEPRGICASGWATSDWYEDKHWDGNGTIHYVGLEWDVLLDPGVDDILPRSTLKLGNLAKVHWNTQQSGIRIRREGSLELEAIWAKTHGRSVKVFEEE